jgi:hypothetical protein
MANLTLPFAGAVAAVVDLFSVQNNLADGQSDDDISRVASVAGHGGICHGVHGDNGQGSGTAPGSGTGVWGESDNGLGVYGASITNSGVQGVSKEFDGVHGESQSAKHAGVTGINNSGGFGVSGSSSGFDGVHGESQSGQHAGVTGVNNRGGSGVWGSSSGFDGVHGESQSPQHAGVSGINTNGGIGVFGESTGTGNAGQFAGNVLITGNLTTDGDIFLPGADCAEQFEVANLTGVDPGTVMVMNEVGALEPGRLPYDRMVAGVVSGAGSYKPALILNRHASDADEVPIALVGRVYCKVDSQYAAIRVGDLLTTSPTPGYAMKADDPAKAFGAIVGKALKPIETGRGLIPILVTLQ